MSLIFVSSYGGKLFLHICKLEWFKGKQIWVDENVFACSQQPYRAVNFDRDLATLFWVQEKFSLTAHWRLQGTFLFNFGGGGSGVSNFVTSLAKWCTATMPVWGLCMPKSLYRTAPPYSILSDSCMRSTLAQTHTKGCRRFKKQFFYGGGGG